MEHTHLVIAGLGLIGGSMALALRHQPAYRVSGIDIDPATRAAALAQDAVAAAGGPELLETADLLVLALPPDTAIAFLREHGHRLPRGAVVTDVCGVKRALVAACAPYCREHGLAYIGGHPMAGREHSGFAQADASLFVGASYILTPEDDTPAQAVDRLKQLAADLGCARLTVTTPAEHDRRIAFTSQLPHVLAGAYVKSPQCPLHRGFSAGSYRDVSRVATVDERLWSRLFLHNRDNLCAEIDSLIDNLAACRDALLAQDQARLEAVLRAGREIKERDLLQEPADMQQEGIADDHA